MEENQQNPSERAFEKQLSDDKGYTPIVTLAVIHSLLKKFRLRWPPDSQFAKGNVRLRSSYLAASLKYADRLLSRP